MDKPWEINSKSVLVLSDAHQDIQWIKDVIEIESGNFDQILFNGDIVHNRRSIKLVSGIRETARFYKQLLDNNYVNLGNHELPIIESYKRNSKFRPLKNPYYKLGGWTKSSTLHFNREMTFESWNKVSLFRVVNGILVSHAGFHSNLWDFTKSQDDNLQHLWDMSQQSIQGLLIGDTGRDIFEAGPSRYKNPCEAKVRIGGPVWLDWDDEFQDNLPLPQLVGHTCMSLTIRKKGRSYNIDGNQSTYAIIDKSGNIKFGAVGDKKKLSPIFL